MIEIPPSTVVGPAGCRPVSPHTPEGAVGQLAAIEVTVLQGMSIPHTNDVYRRWALPGGVGVERWQMTANVQAFLAAAQMGQEKDLSASVVAVPAAGQVKGVDGPDWLVACVLLEIRATITVEARMGYGYCERMQWQNGRWMIAPEPRRRKPSTWPGSELSIKAGWRSWIDAERLSVDPHDLMNPFKYLASEAGKVIADGWTSAMLGLWNAGLWALRLVLNIIDSLLTPDLSANGPAASAYRTTFWLAARSSWSC